MLAVDLKYLKQFELLVDNEEDSLLLYDLMKKHDNYKVLSLMRKHKLLHSYLDKEMFLSMWQKDKLFAIALLTRELVNNSHLLKLQAFLDRHELSIGDFYDIHKSTKKLLLNIFITFKK